MRALKLIAVVALVMVVTGTTWAVTVPGLPGGTDAGGNAIFVYDKSRNADMGSTYVVTKDAAGLVPLTAGDEFNFAPTTTLNDGAIHGVSGTYNSVGGTTLFVRKFGATGGADLGGGVKEDDWGIALMYQLASGHLANPGSNGSIVSFGPQVGAGSIVYDNSAGTQGTWITAMFHSGVDISVDVIQGAGTAVNGIPVGMEKQTATTAGLKAEVYAVDASALDPLKDSVNLTDYALARRSAIDQYTGWTGNTVAAANEVLLFKADANYQQSTVVVNASGVIVSSSLDTASDYMNVNTALGLWGPMLNSNQLKTPDGVLSDVWFQWTLDSGARGWDIHSNDIGGADAFVPEPVTIMGVILGLGGLGGYIRRRFHV
jgi:hypothetical protein